MWALAFGYAISAFIQVFLSREEAAKQLGSATPKKLGLAMLLGAASSSCSFAALSATRSIWAKGAHLLSALAFMFASTNLAVEVAALAFIFLGWQFAVGLFVGAPLIVAVMVLLVTLTRPEGLSERALERARELTETEVEDSRSLPEPWRERLTSRRAWQRAGHAYVMEWRMVWKELAVGFTVAGFVAAIVPPSFFKAIFPAGLAVWLLVPLHALMAPFLAILTFIGSMGNGPLAAILFQHGVMFGGIMAFLYSDFIVPPALKINTNYYGWRFALYLGAVFAAAAATTGVVVHALYALVGIVPKSAKSVADLAIFRIDYAFFLNLIAVAVSALLVWWARRPAEHLTHSDVGDRAG